MVGRSLRGRVYKIESKDIFVKGIDGKEVRCSIRGRIKHAHRFKRNKSYKLDIVSVGEEVEFVQNQDETGIVTEIYERRNYFSRKAPKIKGASYRGERLEQVIASNIDSLIIVSSIISPFFNNRAIDRILVSAESANIKPVIVINKIDLDEDKIYEEWQELYENIGYQVFSVSAVSKENLSSLKEYLAGKTNLFWGASGVGKSTLLNKLFPELELKTGDISYMTQKGTHTTVTSLLLEVGNNTEVIDTPGIREIDPYGVTKEFLGHYFIEFAEYIQRCKFNSCTHRHEPHCAVREGVEDGEISEERYDSYLRILETVEEDMIF